MRRLLVALTIVLASVAGVTATATAAPPHRDPCANGDTACWTAHIQHQAEINAWNTELRKQERYARLVAFAAAVEAQRVQAQRLGGYPAPTLTRDGFLLGSGRCGPGWGLPPCYRLQTESRGLINVYFGGCHQQCHPRYTAQGKWAITNPTWARFMGYRTAALAPEWVQDAKARQLWAGGRGCSHWSTCHRLS